MAFLLIRTGRERYRETEIQRGKSLVTITLAPFIDLEKKGANIGVNVPEERHWFDLPKSQRETSRKIPGRKEREGKLLTTTPS